MLRARTRSPRPTRSGHMSASRISATGFVPAALALAALLASTPARADPPPWAPAYGARGAPNQAYGSYGHPVEQHGYAYPAGGCSHNDAGAVVGGLIGGAIGATVDNHHSGPLPIIVGTVLGAVVGHEITNDCSSGTVGYGYSGGYGYPAYGYSGGPYSGYGYGGRGYPVYGYSGRGYPAYGYGGHAYPVYAYGGNGYRGVPRDDPRHGAAYPSAPPPRDYPRQNDYRNGQPRGYGDAERHQQAGREPRAHNGERAFRR